jgi:VanZ family protein
MSEAAPGERDRVQSPWRRLTAFLPPFAYMTLISWLSSLPLTLPLPAVPHRDKIVHVIEYGLLGLLNAHALRVGLPALRASRAFITAAVMTAAFGYLDELHQAFVPGRDANVYDLLADVTGAALGVAVYALIERTRSAKLKSPA